MKAPAVGKEDVGAALRGVPRGLLEVVHHPAAGTPVVEGIGQRCHVDHADSAAVFEITLRIEMQLLSTNMALCSARSKPSLASSDYALAACTASMGMRVVTG